MNSVTEASSLYHNLEKKTTLEILTEINIEDQKVALEVQRVLEQIVPLIDAITDKMVLGGRLFYIGAGTSGRLGVLDASECPPTYGIPKEWVVGLIAGGDQALRISVEGAEDNTLQAWEELSTYGISSKDVLVGIAASGTTPYVINALKIAKEHGIITGSISCNPNAPISEIAKYPIEVIVGPEYVTGSTRMKSGTAQKLVLNMISTSVMIKLGRVRDNYMVDMQLSNDKLLDRGIKIIIKKTGLKYEEAKALLKTHGSIRRAIDNQ